MTHANTVIHVVMDNSELQEAAKRYALRELRNCGRYSDEELQDPTAEEREDTVVYDHYYSLETQYYRKVLTAAAAQLI